jgi:lipopolysaccharide/colanic/teichoic acid biosynthesis glycosyltransferase
MRRREWTLLLAGDLVLLALSLPIALTVREWSIPSLPYFELHVFPFSILLIVFIGVFFASGLYDVQTTILRRELPGTIIAAQIANILLAALLFFLFVFGVAPKTNLVSYLIVSSVLIIGWRLFLAPLLLMGRPKGSMLVIGDGEDAEMLARECDQNSFYPFTCPSSLSISGKSIEVLRDEIEQALSRKPTLIVFDPRDPRLEVLLPRILEYVLLEKATFIDFNLLFEQTFRRVALSNLRHSWFLTDALRPEQVIYGFFKRAFDILIALLIMVVVVLLAPIVWILHRLEGKGTLFISQERIGKDMQPITIHKFRTMTANESGVWVGETANSVTPSGAVLRRTSLDELPQAWAILTGKLSLIGPRSDMKGLAERLGEHISFYNARYLITPGISGWAQVNQRYAPGNISPQSIEESRVRLAYDLYYVKHRSLFLDLSIALRTLKTLLARLIPKKKHGKKLRNEYS